MTIKDAKRRWSSRRRQYVVGYIHSGNCIFWDGRRGKRAAPGLYSASDPMTLKEAKQLLVDMPSPGAAIFRLTPIAVGGGAR